MNIGGKLLCEMRKNKEIITKTLRKSIKARIVLEAAGKYLIL